MRILVAVDVLDDPEQAPYQSSALQTNVRDVQFATWAECRIYRRQTYALLRQRNLMKDKAQSDLLDASASEQCSSVSQAARFQMIDAHRVNPKLHRLLVEQVPRVGRLDNIQAIDREALCSGPGLS